MAKNEIKITGLTLEVKGHKITLSPEELVMLKQEIEKVLPTMPIIIKEIVYIPGAPIPVQPTYPIVPWQIQPWTLPVNPIIWCGTNDKNIS